MHESKLHYNVISSTCTKTDFIDIECLINIFFI